MSNYAECAESFKSVLKREYERLLASNHVLAQVDRIKKLHAIQAGWIFLTAIGELHGFYDDGSADFRLMKILAAAQQSLITPDNGRIAALSAQVTILKQAIEASNSKNTLFAGLNMARSTLTATLSFVGISYSVAILLGFSSLALGPFGVLALGVGTLIVSSMIGLAAAEELTLNFRFCNGFQLQEINDYITILQTGCFPLEQQAPDAQDPDVCKPALSAL